MSPGKGTKTEHQLSERQLQVLEFIKEKVDERGYPPSVREIGEALGLSSPSTVHSHLSALVRAGLVRRDPSKPRALEILDGPSSGGSGQKPLRRHPGLRDVPLVGRIAAGSPILAAEEVQDVFQLPTSLVGRGPVFMLRIKGDSMIEAGILDGDLVVIERGGSPAEGEIVAALIDGEEATVKRLRRASGQVILEPANPALTAIAYDRGVEVIGRVVSVLRKL
ncbi:MAG: transcriptional repressor LexA [Acidimicrobiia bacterium]